MLASCQSNSYTISGTAEGLSDGDTLFVTSDLLTGIPSDTLIIKDGKFETKGEVDSTALCMVYSAASNEINAAFFLEPGTINIKLTEQPGGSRVSGTHCNDQWQTLNDSKVYDPERIGEASGPQSPIKGNKGFDASKGEYVDMLKSGILDPTKVTRSALQNAASISGLLLTTECLITDVKEEKEAAPAAGMGGMGGMGGMM